MRHLFCLFFIILSFAVTAQPANSQKIVTASVLVNDKIAPDPQQILSALRSDWKMKPDSINISDKTLVFSVAGATVMLAHLDYPVEAAEVQAAASISWLWKNAGPEIAKHQSQVVISILGSSSKALDLYKVLTKVAAATLEKTNSSGVFLNSQYVVSSKPFFIAGARNMMQEQSLPVYCWIYFGMLQENNLNSGYTYGMAEFGKEDMEIFHSEHSVQEVHAALYDATQSIILYNLQLNDGQEVTTGEGVKIPVKKMKGQMLEGEVLRLQY
jgi:hypothetical protein